MIYILLVETIIFHITKTSTVAILRWNLRTKCIYIGTHFSWTFVNLHWEDIIHTVFWKNKINTFWPYQLHISNIYISHVPYNSYLNNDSHEIWKIRTSYRTADSIILYSNLCNNVHKKNNNLKTPCFLNNFLITTR